jgi:hypothetical protein
MNQVRSQSQLKSGWGSFFFLGGHQSQKCSELSARKRGENPTENRGSKRAINCRKPNETGAFKRIGPKSIGAGNPKMGDPKTLVYVHLKNQNVILYRGESAMGKVSSETLGPLFLRI